MLSAAQRQSASEPAATSSSLPPGTVGVAAVLPSNVRVVNSDAELRETLVQAGDDTVRLHLS